MPEKERESNMLDLVNIIGCSIFGLGALALTLIIVCLLPKKVRRICHMNLTTVIEEILKRGNTAEVKRRKDGVIVLEVKREIREEIPFIDNYDGNQGGRKNARN